MSHTFTAEQTVYWKQQAYALMVQEGMSARFAKGQVRWKLNVFWMTLCSSCAVRAITTTKMRRKPSLHRQATKDNPKAPCLNSAFSSDVWRSDAAAHMRPDRDQPHLAPAV